MGSANCPNCGAILSYDGGKHCDYCGAVFEERGTVIWDWSGKVVDVVVRPAILTPSEMRGLRDRPKVPETQVTR